MTKKIKLIAPSGKCDNFEKKINAAIKLFSSNGWELLWDQDILKPHKLNFFASEGAIRNSDLCSAIESDEYQIIWAFRGGYGAANLVQDCIHLNPTRTKTLIGFSDITALHILFNQIYKLPTIHGPVINSFLDNENSFQIFDDILAKKDQSFELKPVANISHGNIAGEIIGGNLAVITTLIGTKLHPDMKDKIILLEDINEKPYQIHRNLMHMKNSGLFDEAKAIIFGEFTNTGAEDPFEAIIDFAENEIKVPSFRINNIGHVKNNMPIILGAPANIQFLGKIVLNIQNTLRLCIN